MALTTLLSRFGFVVGVLALAALSKLPNNSRFVSNLTNRNSQQKNRLSVAGFTLQRHDNGTLTVQHDSY